MVTRTKPISITSWSFSRYNIYKQCPFKAKLLFIDKLKEPGSEAMDRGAEIHTLAEQYIKGKLARLPKELAEFKNEFTKLKKLYTRKVPAMMVEDTWAFTKDWDETTWDDWVGCWVRIKLDCAHEEEEGVLIVTDWKTGKYREELIPDYMEQLELYALGALLMMPHIHSVNVRLAFLDVPKMHPEPDEPLIFTQADLPKLKKLWEKRVKPMLADKKFAPRPNDKCRWCHFRAGNKANGGGQCKY